MTNLTYQDFVDAFYGATKALAKNKRPIFTEFLKDLAYCDANGDAVDRLLSVLREAVKPLPDPTVEIEKLAKYEGVMLPVNVYDATQGRFEVEWSDGVRTMFTYETFAPDVY